MFFTIQERVRRGSEYRAARDRLQAEQAIAAEAHAREEHDAAERRRFLAKVPEEPASGEAGNALLCFHVGGRKVWRRFESCSTLHDLINYVRSLPDVDPRAEVELTNVTTAPAVSLSRPHLAGLTLQRLDLWPSGHLKVCCSAA